MLSLMVHDLRSPLAGIVSHLSLIIEDAPEGHLREEAQAALRSADGMRDSLEEALQIRLLEEGQLPIARAPVDLKALVRDAAATLEPTARRKRIQLSTAMDGEPIASVDGKLVRRAIENLLGNALKYTPAGKDVSVAVRHLSHEGGAQVLDREGGGAVFRVRLATKAA